MNAYRNPAVALMPDVTPKPLRSQANGIINLVGYIGAVIGGLIAMIIKIFFKDLSSQGIAGFLIASFFMILAVVILILKINEPKLVKEMEEEMEEGEKRRKSDDAIWEQRMELCQQFFARIGINHKGKRIAQVETVNAKQGFGINGISPGD